MGTGIETVRALAEVDQGHLPLAVGAVAFDEDGRVDIAPGGRPARFGFTADHVRYRVELVPDADGATCSFSADVGFVPVTVQSRDRREAVQAILSGARRLARVRFVINEGQKITLVWKTHLEGRVTPYVVIWAALGMIQETRPFLRLLGEYL